MKLSERDFNKCISTLASRHFIDLKPLQTLSKNVSILACIPTRTSLLVLAKFVFTVRQLHAYRSPPPAT